MTQKVANAVFIVAMVILVALSFGLLEPRGGDNVTDPYLIAECIAEAAYTNPYEDKFRELAQAVAKCRLEMKR